MEADLEPGFAWMVIATEEGVRIRKQDGKLEVSPAVGLAAVDAAEFTFFPFFVGAIFFFRQRRLFSLSVECFVVYFSRPFGY